MPVRVTLVEQPGIVAEVAVNLVPEHRALLGIDVVGSAGNPGFHLNAVAAHVEELLSEALGSSGVPRGSVLEWESAGDGVSVTLPSRYLGTLLDCAQHLDILATGRNRWRKPEILLRIAVEVGPVGERPGLYTAKIALARMLDAAEFKNLFSRCREAAAEDPVSSALIVSDRVLATAFGGDHTSLVRRGEFAALPLVHKEYRSTAWVRVPGFEPRTLDSFAGSRTGGDPQPDGGRVSNVAYGMNQGVQAHTVNGGVSFGVRSR